jgi:hypothetical protein
MVVSSVLRRVYRKTGLQFTRCPCMMSISPDNLVRRVAMLDFEGLSYLLGCIDTIAEDLRVVRKMMEEEMADARVGRVVQEPPSWLDDEWSK